MTSSAQKVSDIIKSKTSDEDDEEVSESSSSSEDDEEDDDGPKVTKKGETKKKAARPPVRPSSARATRPTGRTTGGPRPTGGEGGGTTRRHTTVVTRKQDIFLLGPGRTSDNTCCCLTRVFLIGMGLAGIILFSILIALHFNDHEKITKRVKISLKSTDAHVWNASLAVCIIMIVVHALLILGAIVENVHCICVFVCLDTFFTFALLVLVALLIVMILGGINHKGIRKKCEAKFGKATEGFKKCKGNRSYRKTAWILGLGVALPAVVVWMIVTFAACSYSQALLSTPRERYVID